MARVDPERSAGSKAAWRTRRKERHVTCPFCKKPIFVGGIEREGRKWHRTCWRRREVAALRKRTAIRGFYKK